MNKFAKSVLFLSLAGFLSHCANQEANAGDSNSALGQELQLKLVGLEPMQGQHYEGWAVGPQGVTSTGRFNLDDLDQIVAVNAEGQSLAVLSDTDSATFAIQDQATAVKTFVLTIEPDGDTDPGPSQVHFLEGVLNNGEGVATLQKVGAIGASFVNAMGSYILATPSNGPTTHNQGIWFVDAGNPSLDFPALNTGFTYEGWIVDTDSGEVLSTGTFDVADQADSDGPGAAAGPNATPSFPGQDYINPARILNDGHHMTVISVEPVPDFDPAPFTLKILRGVIADGAAVTTSFDLENISNEDDIRIEVSIP